MLSLLPSPESHVTLLAAISSTASVAFSDATFNPSQNLRSVEQLKLNTLLLTESQAEEILEESSKFDISSLKKVILTGMPLRCVRARGVPSCGLICSRQ